MTSHGEKATLLKHFLASCATVTTTPAAVLTIAPLIVILMTTIWEEAVCAMTARITLVYMMTAIFKYLRFILFAGGQHCDTCVFGFFRPGGVLVTDPNPCSPCECDTAGSVTADCIKVSYT